MDIHTEVAKIMFRTDNPTPEEREVAKAENFRFLYLSCPIPKEIAHLFKDIPKLKQAEPNPEYFAQCQTMMEKSLKELTEKYLGKHDWSQLYKEE